MATIASEVKGAHRTNLDANPSLKVAASDQKAPIRVLYDSYAIDSADEIGTSGSILMMTIPKGARIIDSEVNAPASGGTGEAQIGWKESAESAAESADADGFYTSDQFDPGDAAIVRKKLANTEAAYGKTFSEAVDVVFDITEVTADAGGDTWELYILYTDS